MAAGGRKWGAGDREKAAVERLGNLLAVFTDAGVDAHARDDDSVLFHCLRV